MTLVCLNLVNAELSLKTNLGDRDPRRWGKRETIPNATLSHHNDSGIKMGSDESHFNVSTFTNCKRQSHTVHKQQLLNQGPSAYKPSALPLG